MDSGLLEHARLGMGTFVGRLTSRKPEQPLGTGADGLLDEIAGIHRSGGNEGDFFEVFHQSLWIRDFSKQGRGLACDFLEAVTK